MPFIVRLVKSILISINLFVYGVSSVWMAIGGLVALSSSPRLLNHVKNYTIDCLLRSKAHETIAFIVGVVSTVVCSFVVIAPRILAVARVFKLKGVMMPNLVKVCTFMSDSHVIQNLVSALLILLILNALLAAFELEDSYNIGHKNTTPIPSHNTSREPQAQTQNQAQAQAQTQAQQPRVQIVNPAPAEIPGFKRFTNPISLDETLSILKSIDNLPAIEKDREFLDRFEKVVIPSVYHYLAPDATYYTRQTTQAGGQDGGIDGMTVFNGCYTAIQIKCQAKKNNLTKDVITNLTYLVDRGVVGLDIKFNDAVLISNSDLGRGATGAQATFDHAQEGLSLTLVETLIEDLQSLKGN